MDLSKLTRTISLVALLTLLAAPLIRAQTAPAPAPAVSLTPEQSQLAQKIEAYLRNLYAWGPEYGVKAATFKDAPLPGFYEVTVEVTQNKQTDTGTVYASKDGRFIMRGEIDDMAGDPFASTVTLEHPDGNPSRGPANAPVTVVEFSDFECPHCRELFKTLQILEPQYPGVRVVFKDFPLTDIHPWAKTAALGARCAFNHSPEAFWKVHDSIFENQDLISPENVFDKVMGFAVAAGLSADEFRACMISPDTEKAVDANIADGMALKINNTPTVFVNGRPLIGGERSLLQQSIEYDLAKVKTAARAPAKSAP
ncbi:MAG: thioredoxin domain-containing protein [Candidatus Acidiferrales bacterium]